MTIGLYARISTDEDRQDLETQFMELREYAEREDKDYKEYKDIITGTDFNRPGLDEMIQDAMRGKIEKIVISELTRLGRTLINLENILDDLEDWGIDLVILDMNIDTSTPVGKLFFQIAGAFAEYERKLIAQRVKRGMKRAKKQGKQIGRPSVEIDEEELIYAEEQREQGETLQDIAEDLGYSYSTFYRRFKDYSKG